MSSKHMMSFKDAAIHILKAANEPLSTQEIVERAMQQGILSTEGKTPAATMGAQLYVDINKNKKSKFKKVGRGKFTLKEQTDSATTPLLVIENQNALVKEALTRKLYEMDPYQFEFLIADLLKDIGYENIEVTRSSGDKGIDVSATLTMGGITDVKTIIQAKRFKKGNNVPGRIIAQLRGSAEVDQRGMVITTSDFTRDAVSEAKASNKMPVSLINGEKLLSLMLKHRIGIKAESITVYSLDNEYFENEEDIERRPQISGKNRSLWPLPGGINSYVDTLFKYLEAVSGGLNTRRELIEWYKKNFDNVKSDKTANGYINVPKNMGLTHLDNGRIKLTQAGAEALESIDVNLLYETISSNILAFDDIVEYMKTSGEIQTEQSILEFLKENFDIEWQSFAQVTYRLLWLMNLGKISRVEGGYALP
jgi:restriction endonuclease Mrr